MILMGVRQPWLSGRSETIRERRTYMIAELTMAVGVFKFPYLVVFQLGGQDDTSGNSHLSRSPGEVKNG